MSDAHKQALAVGREEGRAVRGYMEALEAHRPRRGRKRSPQAIEARLDKIDSELATADPLSRVHLVQERIDLEAQLSNEDSTAQLQELEDGFVHAARDYGRRKGITYSAWRQAGIDAAVLRRAGISRGRS